MNILVLGKGGREHAIIKLLKKSKKIRKIYCAPGNGGTMSVATNIDIDEMDNRKIVEFIKNNNINFVVATPDNPLANGIVDEVEKIGVNCFGPTKKAAKIEYSKIFAKKIMKKYNIPTAKYEIFDDKKKAIKYVEEKNSFPIVIKADGLCFGKGVTISNNIEEAKEAIEKTIKNGEILIEEYLKGPEVSILSFCDGNIVKPMISCMDHKKAFENGGPNTGGMGAIAPNPFYTQEIAKICEEKIFVPTVNALKKEGTPFKGCLYFGLMLTKDGPKVIEYNARFGDPEIEAIAPLFKTDLFSIMEAVCKGNIKNINIEFHKKSCAAVVLTSKGYPLKYETGFEIEFCCKEDENTYIYHNGTSFENGIYKTNGGRVITISCVDEKLEKATEKAYETAEKIKFKNIYYRKDIGKKALQLIH